MIISTDSEILSILNQLELALREVGKMTPQMAERTSLLRLQLSERILNRPQVSVKPHA